MLQPAIEKNEAPTTKVELQSLIGKINFIRRFISNLSGKIQPLSSLLKLKADLEFVWREKHQKALDEIKHYLVNSPVLVLPQKHKSFKLYLSADEHAIRSALIQEFEGKERVIILSAEDSWMLRLGILLLKDYVFAYTFLVPSLDIIYYRLSVLS